MEWMNSGVWALFVVVIAIIALFCIICLFCIFGCDMFQDDYEKAQNGKAREDRRRGRSVDVECGQASHFRSAEELGLLGRGKVVGVGKRD